MEIGSGTILIVLVILLFLLRKKKDPIPRQMTFREGAFLFEQEIERGDYVISTLPSDKDRATMTLFAGEVHVRYHTDGFYETIVLGHVDRDGWAVYTTGGVVTSLHFKDGSIFTLDQMSRRDQKQIIDFLERVRLVFRLGR